MKKSIWNTLSAVYLVLVVVNGFSYAAAVSGKMVDRAGTRPANRLMVTVLDKICRQANQRRLNAYQRFLCR